MEIDRNKSQNEDMNNCVYALIQLFGHSPEIVTKHALDHISHVKI